MKYNFRSIDNLNISIDAMKECVLDNLDTLNNLVSELEKLRLGNDDVKVQNNDIKENIVKKEHIITNSSEEDNTLIEEINYYYLRVRDFNLEESKESLEFLTKELPSRKKSNYQDIVLGINTFLMKDINEIRIFIEHEKKYYFNRRLRRF